jgi:hypothetical protein
MCFLNSVKFLGQEEIGSTEVGIGQNLWIYFGSFKSSDLNRQLSQRLLIPDDRKLT